MIIDRIKNYNTINTRDLYCMYNTDCVSWTNHTNNWIKQLNNHQVTNISHESSWTFYTQHDQLFPPLNLRPRNFHDPWSCNNKSFVSPGHPDTPHNCSILNQTTDSLYVECTEGFDGGLPQKFTIQVDREAATSSTPSKPSTTVYNQTSKVPSFSVGNLDPGTTYDVHIYASNSKGRSETVHFRATTLNLPERRTGELQTKFHTNRD